MSPENKMQDRFDAADDVEKEISHLVHRIKTLQRALDIEVVNGNEWKAERDSLKAEVERLNKHCDILSHVLSGGEITKELKEDAIAVGLGESWWIDHQHEVARLQAKLHTLSATLADEVKHVLEARAERDALRQEIERRGSGWVCVKERMPTREDADSFGAVEWTNGDFRAFKDFDCKYTEDTSNRDYNRIVFHPTHWRTPTPLPPAPESAEGERREFEEWARIEDYTDFRRDGDGYKLEALQCHWEGWKAAGKENP